MVYAIPILVRRVSNGFWCLQTRKNPRSKALRSSGCAGTGRKDAPIFTHTWRSHSSLPAKLAELTTVVIVQRSCAAGRAAGIVCLPELFRSQYFCQSENHANFALAEAIPGPSTNALAEVASFTITFPIAEVVFTL